MQPEYKRTTSWEEWPYASMDDVVAFAEYLDDLLYGITGTRPHVAGTIQYVHESYDVHSLGQLKTVAENRSLDDIEDVTLMVQSLTDPPLVLYVAASSVVGVHLDVRGGDQTTVDGVHTQVGEQLQDEIKAARKAGMRLQPDGTTGGVRGAWRAVAESKWTVPVVGGTIATVAGTLIVLAITGNV